MSNREEEIKKTQEIIINEDVINETIAEVDYKAKAKKNSKKSLFGLLWVLVNIILVVVVGFTAFNGGDNKAPFSEMIKIWFAKENAIFWFLAMGCGLLTLLVEALKLYIMIYRTTKLKKMKLSFKASVLTRYYDNITPLGSGGQPFEIYYLKKGGVPGAESMYLPVASFFLNQLAFLFLCIFAFIFKATNEHLFKSDTLNNVFMVMAYIGAAFSIFIPVMIFAISFMPRLRAKIIKICVRFSYKFKFIKNKGAATREANKLVNRYKKSLFTLAKSKGTLLIIGLLSIIYEVSICSIPYFVIRACGLNANYLVSLCTCVFTYAAISFIPTPGNSGAAEVSFMSLFTMIGTQYIYWAMSYWRFCCYFLLVIIGVIVVVTDIVRNSRNRKKELMNSEYVQKYTNKAKENDAN